MPRLLPLLLLLPVLLAAGCDGDPAGSPGGPIGSKDGAGPALRLFVVDPDGRPLPGARARVRLPFGAGPAGLAGAIFSADDEGFILADVMERFKPKGDTLRIHALIEAPGHLPTPLTLEEYVPHVGAKFTVPLRPAGVLTGRVVDEEGRPVAGAFAYLLPPDAAGFLSEEQTLGARTNEDGEFRIDPAAPGRNDLGVAAEGFVPALRTDVEVAPRETTGAEDVVLVRGGAIAGTVTTPSGEPVAGALVRAYRSEAAAEHRFHGRSTIETAGGRARTGEDGRFRIEGLAAGAYTVDAAKIGHASVSAQFRDVEPGATDLAFVLRPGRSVTFAVVDAESKRPIPKFDVVLAELPPDDAAGEPQLVDRQTVTSPMGATTLPVVDGAKYRVQISAEGHEVWRTVIGPIGPDTPSVVNVALAPR